MVVAPQVLLHSHTPSSTSNCRKVELGVCQLELFRDLFESFYMHPNGIIYSFVSDGGKPERPKLSCQIEYGTVNGAALQD